MLFKCIVLLSTIKVRYGCQVSININADEGKLFSLIKHRVLCRTETSREAFQGLPVGETQLWRLWQPQLSFNELEKPEWDDPPEQLLPVSVSPLTNGTETLEVTEFEYTRVDPTIYANCGSIRTYNF